MIESQQLSFEFKEMACFGHIRTVVMAGGKGTRLSSITGGRYPKDYEYINHQKTIRQIDLTTRYLSELKLKDVVYSANHFLPLYEERFKGMGYKFNYQEPGINHGTDLKNIIEQCGTDKQYLILSTDTIFRMKDLKGLIFSHKKGSMTRAVSDLQHRDYLNYHHVLADRETFAIVGDERSGYSSGINVSDCFIFTASPIAIIDPLLFMETYEMHERLSNKNSGVDLWLEVGFLLAERNRRRLKRRHEFQSLYNAHVFQGPLLDFGTPNSLQRARDRFSSIERNSE